MSYLKFTPELLTYNILGKIMAILLILKTTTMKKTALETEYRRNDDIKMDIRKIGCKSEYWIQQV
jgi:hypothetical protein